MSASSRPIDGRASRAWTLAFKRGFDHAPPPLVHPVEGRSDPVAEELIALLEQADARLIEDVGEQGRKPEAG
jgi:hypothetical protein